MISDFLQKIPFIRRITGSYTALLMLSVVALIGVITYSLIAKSGNPFGPSPRMVISLAITNLALLLALGIIIALKVIKLWLARKHHSVGSRLQTRITIVFSMLSILPTLIVALFSMIYFNLGIQVWFNERVGTALGQSVAVAESYLAEHREIIRGDALAMANDLSREAVEFSKNPKQFSTVLYAQAALRSLTEAIVFQNDDILATTPLAFSLMFEYQQLPKEYFERANTGEVVIITSENEDRVRALVKLQNFYNTYLLVGRPVDAKIIDHVEQTRSSASEYLKLRADMGNIQFKFSVMFFGVALLLLFAAIWAGLLFASKLVEPINDLVTAAERVKAGDLQARVRERPADDEIGTLGRAFNRMTGQLEKQRTELVEVNRQIDARRRFSEAVLAGVSAGVIALDRDQRVNLHNRSALTLLNLQPEQMNQATITQLVPEFSALLMKAANSDKAAQEQISVARSNGAASFLVRIVAQKLGEEIEGYIITFDDITELQAAQRSAAWAGVARRIAHEIKNPLTPIQLAAQRLKKKYSKEVLSEPEVFNKYIDTITRHVGDIGKMVEEFVNFARMPAPVFENTDMSNIIQQAVFSRREVDTDIHFNVRLPEQEAIVRADKGQIERAISNVIKNAMEAMESRAVETGKPKGTIDIGLEEVLGKWCLSIRDDGPGFPSELIDQLTEPYVTTREKGTGLGLAIVKKIIIDHDGTLQLSNLKDSNGNVKGALVFITLPKIKSV
ncbi:MAG: PAS domain-containing sensor histidine kinase [Proteobacteria bacterium]|nr:PAS domain-containing sensor histidine kinase [Pseudomonadota bacterium]